nr:helix-hairpin-helix domain-containing protein [Halalkalibacterium ligniniphilum]
MKLSKREQILVGSSGIIVLLVSVILFLAFGNIEHEEVADGELEWLVTGGMENEAETIEEEVRKFIVVDLKGAVERPGVYEMKEGSRLVDLIQEAGGMREGADERQLNFAARLFDEMVIYVPYEGEEEFIQDYEASRIEQDGKVSINRASVEELQQLPGIGPAKAMAIVTFREENGPFEAIEELTQVSGIGAKSMEQLRELVSLQ